MRPLRYVVLLLLALATAGCSSNPPRSATYTVKRGDTLYSIAWRHRVDYNELARWNRIGRDYVIHPGQVLKVTGRGATAKPVAKAPVSPAKAGIQSSRPPGATQSLGPPLAWQWPVASGAVALTTRPNGGQGLNIGGRFGDEIRAAGDGRVVYSGTGLLGYGQLLIIKHNDTYLSAYGHTQSVAVHEGEVVRAGQRIATMGAGPSGTPLLYFEIRINGTPTNPLPLLPQR
jgi:lipoprotein NlpD